jgi:spermidine synthase
MASCIYREEREGLHLEIWDDGNRRSLWFDDVILQSEIDLHYPDVLPNPVNQAMLAHLMFDRPQRRVLLAGCGGGAIARWLHARAPHVRGEAVELSPTVARLALEYFDFPPAQASHWQLVVDDVRSYLSRTADKPEYDFILVDLEENQSTPAWLTAGPFLADCRARLSPHGALMLNLIVDDEQAASEALLRIRRVLGQGLLLLPQPAHDNLLVLAFCAAPPELPDHATLARLGRQWGLDFNAMAARIKRLPVTLPG